MRFLLAMLVAGSVVLLVPGSASACDPAVASVVEALRGADTIVRVDVRVDPPPAGSRAAPRRIRMTVRSVLRGKPARGTFEFAEPGSTCDTRFVDGQQMIVPISNDRPSSAYYDTYAFEPAIGDDVEKAVKALLAAKTDAERRAALVAAVQVGGAVAADAASVMWWDTALQRQLTEAEKQQLRAAAKVQGKRAPHALVELVKALGAPARGKQP